MTAIGHSSTSAELAGTETPLLSHASTPPAGRIFPVSPWCAGGWIPPLLIVPLVGWMIYGLLPRVHFPDPPPVAQIILPYYLVKCRPEPLEDTQYLTALTLVPLLSWLALLFVSWWVQRYSAARGAVNAAFSGENARSPGDQGSVRRAVALLAQALLVWLVIFHISCQWRAAMPYFVPWDLLRGAAVAAPIGLLLLWLLRRRSGTNSAQPRRWNLADASAFAAAFTLTLLCLLPALQTFRSFPHASNVISGHLAYTMGDFAAIMNGRSPLVDFVPQYQEIAPYLLYPWFRLVGLNVATFTFTAAAFSLAGLLFHYHILRRITASPWVALALYLPMAAFSVFTLARATDNGPWEYFSEFNYYANAPLRYFGPWMMGWLLVFLPVRPSFKATAAFLAMGSLIALNNPDFGLPALVGATLCILLLGPGAPFPPWAHWLKTAGALAIGFTVALLFFCAISYAHAGALPDLAMLLTYQRIFAVVGFAMLPLPEAGLYVPVFLTFLAAIYVAITRVTAARNSGEDILADPRQTLLLRALLYAGVFGGGAFFYFVGRSHPYNLVTMFPVWAFCVMLLLYAHYSWLAAAFRRLSVAERLVQGVPAGLLAACYVVCAAWLTHLLPIGEQIHRLTDREEAYPLDEQRPDYRRQQAHLVQIIRDHTTPGEDVCIIYPMGHLLAQRAGVSNVFPFAAAKSVLAYVQFTFAMDQLRRHHVRHYFGELTPYAAQLQAAGLHYTPLEGDFGIGEFLPLQPPRQKANPALRANLSRCQIIPN